MSLRDVVLEKALQRLAHEGKDNDEAVLSGQWEGNREGVRCHSERIMSRVTSGLLLLVLSLDYDIFSIHS